MTPSSVRFLVRDFGFIRRASILAAIFASVITLLLPGVSVAQIAAGITAAYALNENAGVTAADSSGNANNGTLTNGPTWGTGKYGSSVHFDGVNDFISVPSATSLNIGAAGTIEAWVKIDSLGRWHSVLSKGTANNDSKQNYAMEITTANKVYCILGSGNSNRTATSTSTLAAGQFYHLACAWNGTNLQIYINGTLNTSVTQNLTPAANTSPLYIGQFAGNADQLQGYIDEVRIYGRALSATEIQTDMNTPLGVSAPPDTTNPTASMTSPLNGASLSGSVTVSANASDNVGVVGVQFLLDGSPLGTEDTTAPYSISWDTTTTSNGSHNLSARARDAAGNLGTSTSISVSVSNSAPPPPGGLVAAYALNEGSGTSAADLSGNSNNGTLTNGPTWAAGKYGLGVNFDGVNDYVQVNNSSTLGLGGTGTLEAWVKVNTLGKWHGIIAKGSSNNDPANSYAIEISNSNNFLCILGNGVSASVLTSSSAVAVGQFYHIACTWNGATALMYVNGTQNASAAQGVTPAVNTAPLTIGQYGGNSDPTSGIIDEVRIYNRALSATEIQTDMNTALVAAQPPDTTNPTATMTAPGNNATVSGTIAVSANASDNVGVVGVQFLLDGSPLGAEDTTAPYSISWDSTGASNASHTLSARARDAAGNLGTSAGVNVTVNNTPPDTTNPTSSMTSPLNNATVSGTIAVSANASDNVGVVGVQFLLDGSPLGAEDTTAPYSISWDSTAASNASHTLSARARDAAGNLGTSAGVNVTVNNIPPDTTNPTSSMTSPLNNATVSGTIAVSANASDNVGVVGVQFLLDGSPLGAEDTTAPYSISWDSTAASNASHTLSARARDAAGNLGTSTSVNVTVNNTPLDSTPPTISLTAPSNGATVSGTITLSANATDNVAIAGVQFFVDGSPLGAEDTTAPYSISWNSTTAADGAHSLSARARDTSGNPAMSGAINITVANTLPPPPSGLMSAYPLNEGSGTTAVDISGHNNNGTLTNGPTWTAAKYGTGVAFDGVNDYIRVNDSATLGLSNTGTIEAWVKVNAVGIWHGILAKGSSNTDPSHNYAIEINNDNRFLCILGNGTNSQGLTSNATVAAGQFYHIACSWNGTALSLYVNGALNTSVAQAITPVFNLAPLTIGEFGGNTDPTKGVIDEVRIYNRALSSSEIQTDMITPLAGSPPPDSGPPTVSLASPAAGGTVTGLTTLFANASDDTMVIGVQFYLDGAPYGSEISTDPYTITWNSASASNTTHVITAVARDAAGNQTTSSPVTVTVANTGSPALVGSWTAPFNWPIVAINLTVTRTGEVMSWDGPPSNGGTSALLWSPTTGTFTAIPNNSTNMFCDAAVALADGRIMAMGGHAAFVVGITNADIFNPITKQWSSVASMHYPRWYPTATVLPDGRVLAVSGAAECETCISSIPEIYNPATNTWTAIPSADWAVNLYPMMFVLPDGRVLEAGVTRQITETRVLDLTTQTWTTVDPTLRDGHSAVMYEPGKVMKSGSAADVNVTNGPSASTTFVLDMTQPSPKWVQTPNMAYPRSFHNLTLLPDGSVVATAGGLTRDGVDYANSVLNAEIWSPDTKTWTTMAAQQNGRLYHDSAVLLLDGRVLVAGSGRVGPTPQFNAEIFSPPYLFKGPRPTITSAPSTATYGSTFFAATPDASNITSVTLLKISSATHSVNMDQRILRLNFTQTAGGLNVVAPANSNLAPPGYYSLYILNSAGVPSVAAVIQIQ